MTRTETKNMSTEIQTIGGAILAQTAIRYAAYIFIAWLGFSYADGWVMAWLK